MTELEESKTRFRLEEIPPPPETLSPGAREHWLELIPLVFELRTARVCDIPALVLMCEARADLDALQSAIRTEGHTTRPDLVGKKQIQRKEHLKRPAARLKTRWAVLA